MDISIYKKYYPKEHLGIFVRRIIKKLVNHDSVAIYGVKSSGRHFVLRHIRAYFHEYTRKKWLYVELNAKILENCTKETLSYAICDQIVNQIPQLKEEPFSDFDYVKNYITTLYLLLQKCTDQGYNILFIIYSFEFWLNNNDLIMLFHGLTDLKFKRFPILLASDLKILDEKYSANFLQIASNTYLIPPLTNAGVETMMKANSRIFHWKINEDIISKCKKYSGNNPGFVKYLHRVLSNNPNASLDEILEDETIRFQCNSHIKELKILLKKKNITFDMLHSGKYSSLLHKAGYLIKGNIFSPLFDNFLAQKVLNTNILREDLIENLPKQEYEIFVKMKKDLGKIFSYEDIATIMWQDKSREKFSLWAIYQTMASLRKLLKNSNYSVKTIRRRGYKLVERE